MSGKERNHDDIEEPFDGYNVNTNENFDTDNDDDDERRVLELKFDTDGDKAIALFDGLVNKFLRQYLLDKFSVNTNDAVNDYKVDTRALGGLYDNHRIPIIMRKKTDLKLYRTTVDAQKNTAVHEMGKWINDIDKLDFIGNISEYLNHDKIKEIMKAKLVTILEDTRTRRTGWFGSNDAMFGRYKKTRKVGGNSQRKRSRKNITRRKM